MSEVSTRPATADDLPAIAQFIRDLAAYEKLEHEVRFDETELAEHLFGAMPRAEVLIGEVDGAACGFALFFPTFSTFEGMPGIWLEDLFVDPAARGKGLGKALLCRVAEIARQRGCARLEWSVLDWNEPSIGFYHSLGARMMQDWRIMRTDGRALLEFGGN